MFLNVLSVLTDEAISNGPLGKWSESVEGCARLTEFDRIAATSRICNPVVIDERAHKLAKC